MEKYKELKDVERAFDEFKNMLNLRPIYHSTDGGVKGDAFVCILALLLRKLMEKETGESFESVFEELKEGEKKCSHQRGGRNCRFELCPLLKEEKKHDY